MTPRKKKAARDPAREQALLDATLNPNEPTGVPALDAVLSNEFVQAKDREALPIALALQEFLRGQASLNAQLQQGIAGISEHLSKLNERMDRYDQTMAAYQNDRDKFVTEVLARAEKLKLPEGERKDRLTARVGQEVQAEIAAARAGLAVERVEFHKALATMPQVKLAVQGRIEVGPNNKPRLIGEEIRIKDKVWALRPGQIYEVPQIVADRYQQMLREREETEERKALLSAEGDTGPLLKDIELARRWDSLSGKYGAGAEALSPFIASTAR